METYFQFRYSSCSGACIGFGSASTTGSTVKSSSRTSDYSLLQLSQNPPAGSVFLGWNATPVANSNGTDLYRISHPKGAPQSYSEHDVDTSAGNLHDLALAAIGFTAVIRSAQPKAAPAAHRYVMLPVKLLANFLAPVARI